MSDLADRIADLTPEKRELLRQRLAEQRAAAEAASAGRPQRRGQTSAPLSFGQLRLWFLQQLDPQSSRFNLPAALRLEGRLDRAALQRTIAEIIRRHEILRTTFTLVSGQPLQVIAPAGEFKLRFVDLSEMAEPQRRAEAERLGRLETEQTFDLERGPLVRATLLRLSREEHLLLWTMHHIVSDGWSLGLLVKEVAALYAAFVSGQPGPLPELPIQYADYAVWQRDWLQGAVLDKQLAYWKAQLGEGGLSGAASGLPTDFASPAAQTHRGAALHQTIPQALAADLYALSRREGVTLFMTLLAAFQTLLYRYTGQERINVGTPIANRTRGEVESLIGFFVNTLVLSTDLSGEPSFRQLLQRVKEVALGAFAHQDVPYEKLVEVLQPERSLSRPALFQVWFVLQNMALPSLKLPGLVITRCDPEYDTVMFDVMLFITENEGALDIELRYNTDLYTPATMREFLAHYEQVLAEMVAHPEGHLLESPPPDEDDARASVDDLRPNHDAEDQFLL